METLNCIECNITFKSIHEKANHVRWVHMNADYYIESKLNLKNACKSRPGYLGPTIEKSSVCNCCNRVFLYNDRELNKEKRYCSRACSNSRGPRSDKFKTDVGNKICNLWKDGHYDQTTALNHNSTKIFSSKIERLITSHFKEQYPIYNWKSGGSLKVGDSRISRDMWSDELRVCFEYDGDWHFIDIHNQLVKKKYKDSLLEKWCIENNYRLIRVDERSYNNLKQIEDLIFNTTDQIIKIGNRY